MTSGFRSNWGHVNLDYKISLFLWQGIHTLQRTPDAHHVSRFHDTSEVSAGTEQRSQQTAAPAVPACSVGPSEQEEHPHKADTEWIKSCFANPNCIPHSLNCRSCQRGEKKQKKVEERNGKKEKNLNTEPTSSRGASGCPNIYSLNHVSFPIG